MANSKLASEFRVQWAELRFPPLNLWLMASLTCDNHQNQATPKLANVPRKNVRTLHKLHQQLDCLLAVRGGRYEH